MKKREQRCVRCNYPCSEALFNSSIDCTNPDCPFFPKEAREVLDMCAEAERMIRAVFP
jgi:hypothetical protein